ncbi:MAG: alpha/beta hydrolase-fold protein [Bacteroidota bacterium]
MQQTYATHTQAQPRDHNNIELVSNAAFRSKVMGKTFSVDIYLPLNYRANPDKKYKVLYANDGQDMPAVRLRETLDSLQSNHLMEPVIVVAVHADSTRRMIYGTANQSNYRGFGALAGKYTLFILQELMPYVEHNFNVLRGPENTAFMGFSLGGLSAFDIVWNHPGVFSQSGVFSGSFWWRSKGYDDGYTDLDRIMHAEIRNGKHKPGLGFWLQTGTKDETSDRDKDGIIDSIGDTMDIIRELKKKDYSDRDIRYLEIVDGEHNQKTWAIAMPDFLTWAYGTNSK